jgi:hypothetical protein
MTIKKYVESRYPDTLKEIHHNKFAKEITELTDYEKAMAAAFLDIEQIIINQNDINNFNTIMFDALTVSQTDNSHALAEKLNAIKSFRVFLTQLVRFDSLNSRETKVKYIKLMDKLNQQIEHLEIATGQKTIENLEKTGKQFAKKTQYPIGIE